MAASKKYASRDCGVFELTNLATSKKALRVDYANTVTLNITADSVFPWVWHSFERNQSCSGESCSWKEPDLANAEKNVGSKERTYGTSDCQHWWYPERRE